MGDVEIGVAGGFADDDEAGFFGGGDVFGGDFDEEAAGCFAKEEFGDGEATRGEGHLVGGDAEAGRCSEGHFGERGIKFVGAEGDGMHHIQRMSALALEIDQTLQQLDAATASRLERLVRDALALVKSRPATAVPVGGSEIQFPLVKDSRSITGEECNGFQIIPAKGRVITSEMVQRMLEESEAA